MKYAILGCMVLLLASCSDAGINNHLPSKGKPVIVLQPLGDFPKRDLFFLKDSIAKFYPVIVSIAPQKQAPANAWYEPRKRWVADTILNWLRASIADSIRLTIGLIADDISTTKGTIKNYGIMGLGNCPGRTCTVSSFRLTKNIRSQQQFQQRLFKVVAHEMGHNFGLPHCPDQQCIMVDAEGKMKLEGEKGLCDNCKKKLKI